MLADLPHYNHKNPKFLNQMFCKAQVRLCEAYRAGYSSHDDEKSESVFCWK